MNRKSSKPESEETALEKSSPQSGATFEKGLAAGIGICFALVLLKLGTPVVIRSMFDPPRSVAEVVTQPWPDSWGLILLLVVVIAGALTTRFQRPLPMWAFCMPVVWLGWQFVAATRSVDKELSNRTLLHFTAIVVSFYIGWLVLGRLRQQRAFWLALTVGFILVLASGFRQNYGELETMKRFVEENERTGWVNLDPEELRKFAEQGVLVRTPEGFKANPEFLKRVRGGRVYATFAGYPNALAGAILLLLPVVLAVIWEASAAWPSLGRKVVLGLVVYMALACLVWSGSKSGWLILLGMAGVAFWHLRIPKLWKLGVMGGLLAIGMAGVEIKYADYFKRGATSVGARVDYWQVALRVAKAQPVFGSGPGTFGRVYQANKRPEAEMAQLAHNDYLEQASDSGWLGFLAYLAMLPGSLWVLYRRSASSGMGLMFSVWLGLAGWAVQGLSEFSLYIPALSWVAFVLLGLLWSGRAQGNEIDKPEAAR